MDNPANRLSPIAAFLARNAHLIALALFAVVGLAVFDDYGLAVDEPPHRRIGYASYDYIVGSQNVVTVEGIDVDRYYGVAFELPLVVAERLLGLEDSRDIYLSRRLITHLLFLAGGFFAWLLAYRLFGSRLIALFAMLIFLSHPRIYAHSFFNTKDLPFLSMFMIALYLTHRAFRRDSVWAFALCGAGVALLMNIRIMGVMLLIAVLGMLALDGFHAMRRGDGGIKRALANSCAFLASFAAALYATWPLLWRDPTELADAVRIISRHPINHPGLFRGELVRRLDIPWDYVPAWALITTPPAALILAALGIAAVAVLCAARWRDTLANTPARFGLLMVACLVLPAAAAFALNSNMYHGWRQMYFLYAPMTVLSAFGLTLIAEKVAKPRLRAAAFAAAALGIAAVFVQIVSLHPYQHEYFNPLAGKSGIADRWSIEYWNISHTAAVERMLSLQPAGRVSVNDCDSVEHFYRGLYRLKEFALIPREDRMRISVNGFSPDFCVERGAVENPAWTLELYSETIISLVDRRDAARADYLDAYAAAKAAKPVFEAHFAVYAIDGALIYIREPCGEGDELGTFTASARPVHPNETIRYMREDGFGDKRFQFWEYGKIVEGACVMALRTPDYPLESMRIAYRAPGSERELWSADIPLNDHLAAYETAMSAEPLARSGYDIYADVGALTYIKEDCAESDTRARFFLSIFPEDPADLPGYRRAAGFEYESLSFDFHRHGAAFGGKCAVVRELPDYPISRIETGQWIPALPGESALWRAGFAPPEFYERRLRLAESSGEPAIRSDFDVYLEDDSLTYIKRPCAESDARGRFWLSVFPANPDDLPQERRDAGFEHESLNFDFANYGAIVDGACVIVRNLPDYPIDRIETGQFIPDEGELWRGRIEVGE